MVRRHSWSSCARVITAFLTVSLVVVVSGQLAETRPETSSATGATSSVAKLPPPQPIPNTGRLSHNFAKDPDSYVVVEPLDKNVHSFVKFEDPKSRKLIVSMFIRAGASFSVSNQIAVPSDSYLVKVASGTNWFGADGAFGPEGNYSVMRPPINVEPYTRYYLRLRSGPKGTLRQENLKWSQF